MSATVARESLVFELKEVQMWLREQGEYRKANMLDFALGYVEHNPNFVTVKANDLEHLLNCMDNQKFIHEQNVQTQQEWQAIIDKANYEMRRVWLDQAVLPMATVPTEQLSEAEAEPLPFEPNDLEAME